MSAILQAISTAPTSQATQLKFSRSKVGTFLAGAASTLSIDYLMDAYYNPVPFTLAEISLASQNQTLEVNGLTYKTTTAGDDRIYILHKGVVVQSFPVKTVDAPATMAMVANTTSLEAGKSAAFSITATDVEGKPLVYEASQLKWSVEGDVGTISPTGVFTAGVKEGKGKIIATLGTKTIMQDIIVIEPSLFKDIPIDYPYKQEINYLVKQKIITGYSDGTFLPTKQLTRAQAAVMITRALKLDTSNVKNPNFADVPVTHPYYKEIAAVANQGIVGGKQGGVFDPAGTLTRGQMAKILATAYRLTGTTDKVFKDVKTTDWLYEYVQALAYHDVTTGYSDGTFKPNVAISREHFSLFLYRAMQ